MPRWTPAAPALILVCLVASGARAPIDLTGERARVLAAADRYLVEAPITVTAASSPRSAGGLHDFFSEGDYWWPDPQNPDGPYIQRDGMTNPDNFTKHREYLMRLSIQVPALVAAWRLTGDQRYALHAVTHLRAWFVDPATRMNPNLQYAQAIHGRVTGRGTGIIDTIHLVEVARAIEALDAAPAWSVTDKAAVRAWFAGYLTWLTSHPYGIAERDAKNNHGTCWAMQVAAFAHLTGNRGLMDDVRERFKTVLVPHQIAADGSFPEELRRTKPYGYSLFNLDAMATVAQILSTPDDNLWRFELADGRGLRRAMDFMVPYIRDKKRWPKPPDVMYDGEWPMRQASLLFAGIALNRPDYLELWSKLPVESSVPEVIRNFFIRQPLLWIQSGPDHAPERGGAGSLDDRPVGNTIVVRSPAGHVAFEVWRRTDARLSYRVLLNERSAVEPSALGIVVDGVNLGDDVEIGAVVRTRHDGRYRTRGVHEWAVDRYTGATIALTNRPTGTRYSLEVRTFDSGVGFRYIVPAAAQQSGQRTPDEATVFNLPQGSTVWYHDLEGHYEGVHQRKDLLDVAPGDWVAPPMTVRLPDKDGYISITEAGLAGYAGMVLQAQGNGAFASRLAHGAPVSYPYRLRYSADDIKRLAIPVRITGTITTPWRVVLAGTDLNTLVNSDVISDLSPPPDRSLFPDGAATAWVKPGRAVWRYLDGGENTFEGIKEFSDLAAKLGFEYNVVEGIWRRWTDVQLRDLVAHSRERGVGIFLWVHSRDLRDGEARRALFERFRRLGVVGAKIDFFDHEAKEVIDLYQDILHDAAVAHLLLDFHGANKPTGESRTWPNELTREGVYGLEHRSMERWAEHNATLPFTRFLAGSGDYTPVVFGERRRETSWPHQIATAIVFTSPLLVYGAHPQSLLDNPAVDVIRTIPSTWDDTIVLPESRIGDLAAFARRSGKAWFLGVLNGPQARTVRLRLDFLGARRYRAVLVRDEPSDPAAERIADQGVTRQSVLTIELRAGGGFAGRLTPVEEEGGA
jgi:alpha-glucosidase